VLSISPTKEQEDLKEYVHAFVGERTLPGGRENDTRNYCG
jgi:hypothetical protein